MLADCSASVSLHLIEARKHAGECECSKAFFWTTFVDSKNYYRQQASYCVIRLILISSASLQFGGILPFVIRLLSSVVTKRQSVFVQKGHLYLCN